MTKVKLEAVFWFVILLLAGIAHAVVAPFLHVAAIFLIAFGKGKYKQYGINMWEGVDNSISADTGGDPDESVSSRLGKARRKGSSWGFVANKVDLVFGELFNDKNHIERSVEKDEGKKQVTTY